MIPDMRDGYVGRFAPSPTGPLHYGSLVAALASYLDARRHHGVWLLRIEDLDPPRESTIAPDEIIRQLKHFELNWDGDVLFQSSRLNAYEKALDQLCRKDLVYACTCSRKTATGIYPGVCRHLNRDCAEEPFALRLKLNAAECTMEDAVFGNLTWDLQKDVGDFVIKRKDGLFAYQLAVSVDDHYQDVTHVVRGADLLDSTPRQLSVYQALAFPPPRYAHIPVLVDRQGNKLSKQSHASPVEYTSAVETLRTALASLGQDRQADCRSTGELLAAAVKSWHVSGIPKQMSLPG